MTYRLSRRLPLPAVVLGTCLSGCGGGDNQVSPIAAANHSSGTTVLSGMAIAGAVDGTLTVRDAAGSPLASTPVNRGAYTVTVPDAALAEELDFEVIGHYTDEVSGVSVALTANDPLALRVAAGYFPAGHNGNAPITPDSTVIRTLITEHGMQLPQARATFLNAFGYEPNLSAVPFDPATTPSSVTTTRPQHDKDAAFRTGAFSLWARDLGLSGNAIASLPNTLARDLSDGDLDGKDDRGNAVTHGNVNFKELHALSPLTFRLLKAYGKFVASAANHARLSAPLLALPPLPYDMSGAQKTITTALGRRLLMTLESVAAAPFRAEYWTAHVRHRLSLVDADTLLPIDTSNDPNIIGVYYHPMMTMLSDHAHTTPHDHESDTHDMTQGRYEFDAYYVMASAMARSMPVGVWDDVFYIKEDSDGNRATHEASTDTAIIFNPQVRSTPGSDVLSVSVGHANDLWTNSMGATQPRPYYIWLHDIAAHPAGGHDLTLFLSTQNIANPTSGSADRHDLLTFPAVRSGRLLQGPADISTGMRPDVRLVTVTVEVSIDNGASWQKLTAPDSSGHHTISQLAGLDSGDDKAIAVRLTVNGKTMTTASGDVPRLQFKAP